jgi:hypothetical protein
MRPMTVFSEAKRRAAIEVWPTADVLFSRGMDTKQIASSRWQPEYLVHRELTVQRSLRLGLPNPYMRQPR